MKIKILLLFMLSLFSPVLITAQSPATEAKTSALRIEKKEGKDIVVRFNISGTVENAIVSVRDDKGELMFMDVKHRFSGKYERIISLAGSSASYAIQVRNDDEEFTHTIIMNQ